MKQVFMYRKVSACGPAEIDKASMGGEGILGQLSFEIPLGIVVEISNGCSNALVIDKE